MLLNLSVRERAQLTTAALNLLSATAPLRACDGENARFLVDSGLTIDVAVIASIIEQLEDRDQVLMADWEPRSLVGSAVENATAALQERDRRELPHLYDSPGFLLAPGTQASSTQGSGRSRWPEAPSQHQLNELESALVISLYEECRRKDPRNSDHAARCLALARAQPRPLELSHLIRDTAVSEAGRSLDWHLLYTTFFSQLEQQSGPGAWEAALSAAAPRRRSASTPPRPAQDLAQLGNAIANQLGTSLGPAITQMAEAVRSSPERSSPGYGGGQDALAMARALAQEMAVARRADSLEDRALSERKDSVNHGNPPKQVWFNFSPTQAEDFGSEAREWGDLVKLYGYTHRRHITDADRISQVEIAAALPSENDSASGTSGTALLAFREGRGKLHELLVRAFVEQLCIRSPTPDVERESQTVADMLHAALTSKTYMHKHSARLSHAERSVGSERLLKLLQVLDSAFISRGVTPEDIKEVFRGTRWTPENRETGVDHLRRLHRYASALGEGDHTREIYAQYRSNIKAVRTKLGEGHVKYEALGQLIDLVYQLASKQLSVGEAVETLEASSSFAAEWQFEGTGVPRTRSATIEEAFEDMQIAARRAEGRGGTRHFMYEYHRYFADKPELIPSSKEHLRAALLQVWSGDADGHYDACPMCQFLDIEPAEKYYQSIRQYKAEHNDSMPFGKVGCTRKISDHKKERMRHACMRCDHGAEWMWDRPDSAPYGLGQDAFKSKYPYGRK